MDMLSSILANTHLHSSLVCGLTMRDGVAINYETGFGVAAHYVQTGTCWLELPDEAPRLLSAGDFVLLPRWPEHALALTLGHPHVTIRSLVEQTHQPMWSPGTILSQPIQLDVGEGEEQCRVISLIFHIWDAAKNPVLNGLPDIAHLRPASETTRSLLETLSRFIDDERAANNMGFAAVSNKLAELVFTQAVREQFQTDSADMTGLLRGLADPALASLLPFLHERPEAHWTIGAMAAQCGLSRSLFAVRFKAIMATTPRDYLTTLRMARAADVLRAGQRVKTAAAAAGFRSEPAFAIAFHRAFGKTPGQFRDGFTAQGPNADNVI